MKLNGLPNELSGLIRSYLPDEYSNLHFGTFMAQYKISEDDLKNFYTFVALTDQLKRLDSLLRDSTSTVSAILN
jgi:hypothetical protein